MNKRLILLLLSLFVISFNAQSGPALNKDGSIVTGVLTASFDPRASKSAEPVFPLPTTILYTGTTDFTLNPPVADPDNIGDPLVALSALDGFSTTEKWITSFANGNAGLYNNAVPGKIDPASVVPGQSVRVFEVTLYKFAAVTSIVRELTPWVEYVAVAATDSVLAILPTKPLAEYSSYMAVLTNDIRDVNGNDATPDQTYFLGKRRTPWLDENGHSTYSLFSDEFAAQLEPFRQVVQSMELNAAAFGVKPDDIVLSWTVQTQSITRTLKTLRALAQPAPTQIGPTGMNTGHLISGSPGLADIHMGVITLPYYLDAPSAENPAAHLSSFWKAAPGAYVPPFDQFGLDPTSTHITIANPIPVKRNDQTVPIIVTVPNASSGKTKPASGWPVVIFGHAITRNRLDVLAVADTLASIGYAAVAIDFPLHGISPDDQPTQAPFWIENTPFAPIANERTFDADFLNNETLTFGSDGLIDPSGFIFMPSGIASTLTGRDNFRQGIADLSVLAVSVSSMDIDLDAAPDLDASNMAYVGISWGALHGTGFVAIEPLITRAYLSEPAGGIARFANASPWIGPIVEGVLAQAGIEPGTADYEQFLLVWQTVLDPADPINWAAAAAVNTPIMLHEVIDNDVIPNYVPGAPLSGTEPVIAVMGLDSYSTSQASPDGLRSAARFVPPAEHAVLLSPTRGSPAAFFEMQKQMASFVASHGGAIVVTDESTMLPEVQIESTPIADLTEKRGSEAGIDKKQPGLVNKLTPANRFDLSRSSDRLNSFE